MHVRAACISLRMWSSYWGCVCASLMRCNWLLERRGVEGDDLLDHQPCATHPWCFVPSGLNSKTHSEEIILYEQRQRAVLVTCLECSDWSEFVVFLAAIDLLRRTFHQWGKEKGKKRKCGNHYSNGDRGGISFGFLLGLFLPIYSISCYWLVNTNLLQMMWELRTALDVLLPVLSVHVIQRQDCRFVCVACFLH